MIVVTLIAFAIGILCGHQWPQAVGCAIAAGAVLSIVLAWYADRSSDSVYDLLNDYVDFTLERLFLPWVAGALVGVILLLLW